MISDGWNFHQVKAEVSARRCRVTGKLRGGNAIVKLRRAGAFVSRHVLRFFESAARFQIDRDPGGSERVVSHPMHL